MTHPIAAVDHEDGTRTYSVPHRETGELHTLPNVTGIIGLADPKHICDWKLKMAMLGAALRQDITAMVAAGNLLDAGPPRNGELRRVAERAIEAGQIIEKGHLPGERGSALHSLTERLDELVPAGAVEMVDELGLPKSIAAIARDYVSAMAGITVVHTEVTVASFAHGYAGTGDRIIRFGPLDAWATAFDRHDLGRGCFVLDNKFGRVHTDECAMQLAALAAAETIWDARAGTHTPMPEDLRQDLGFIFNPDKGLIPVPLDGALDAFLGLVALKRFRDRDNTPTKNATPLDAGSPAPGEPTEKRDQQAPGSVPGGTPGHEPGVTEQAEASSPAPAHPFDEPVHVSEPLAAVVDNVIAADPFAGLPGADGTPQINRAAKRAWLVERAQALAAIDGGLDALAARWPVVDGTPVPTFRESTDQSAGQLALIQAAITDAEAAVHAPFRHREDPTDPTNIVVPAGDPRIAELIERGRALPPDLQDDLHAASAAAKLPALNGTRRLTEADLAKAGELIAAAEATWMPRAKTISEHLTIAAEHGISEAAICAALGVPDTRHIVGHSLTHLANLADAAALGIVVERDGALVVDQPAAVLTQHGESRDAVLKAGRQAAKANGLPTPASSDAVLADPVLTAAVAVV